MSDNISRDDSLNHHTRIKTVFHIDMDYFYAQCEEIRNPSLKKLPLVICVYSGRTEDSGVVSTCNYLARSFGIRSGISIKVAKAKLLHTKSALLSADIDHYTNVSNNATKLIEQYGENFEKASIDEFYIDFTRTTNSDFSEAKSLAKSIQMNFKRKMDLSCSIGVGHNKMIAKIASATKKPNGITVILPNDAINFISYCKIEDIPNVGPKTSGILRVLGIKTLADVKKKSIFELSESVGYKTASFLVSAANAIDYSRIRPQSSPRQMGKIVTIKKGISFDSMIPIVSDMCGSVISRLNDKNLAFRTINILLILENLEHISSSKKLKIYSTSPGLLIENSLHIINQLFSDKSISLQDIRRIGITVSDIKDIAGQHSLFDYINAE
jgi:DNA polymerase IV (DinB-like DNA polymerase)